MAMSASAAGPAARAAALACRAAAAAARADGFVIASATLVAAAEAADAAAATLGVLSKPPRRRKVQQKQDVNSLRESSPSSKSCSSPCSTSSSVASTKRLSLSTGAGTSLHFDLFADERCDVAVQCDHMSLVETTLVQGVASCVGSNISDKSGIASANGSLGVPSVRSHELDGLFAKFDQVLMTRPVSTLENSAHSKYQDDEVNSSCLCGNTLTPMRAYSIGTIVETCSRCSRRLCHDEEALWCQACSSQVCLTCKPNG